MENTIEGGLKELHNKGAGCTTRAQLMYLLLKRLGIESKILRYLVKGEIGKDNMLKLTLLDGQQSLSHVVVCYENKILDPNIGKIISREAYEERLSDATGREIESVVYPNVDIGLCRQYVKRYNLKMFRFILQESEIT